MLLIIYLCVLVFAAVTAFCLWSGLISGGKNVMTILVAAFSFGTSGLFALTGENGQYNVVFHLLATLLWSLAVVVFFWLVYPWRVIRKK